MSLNTKFTHIEEILERVRREFGFEDVFSDDVREWIWDVIGLIGSPTMLIDKIEEIEVRNHRGELPPDVFSLTDHMVRDKQSKQVLKKSANIYFEDDAIRAQNPRVFTDGESYEVDENGEIIEGTKYISIIAPETEEAGYFYNIKENYIFTNKSETVVEISYTAFPMDDRLYPLVPDDPKVIRAVVWFIGERLAFKHMLRDKLSERKYDRIKQDYLFNVAAARTKADALDMPEVHNFKYRVLQMSKQNDAFRRGFK